MKYLYNNKGITMPIVLIALVLSLIFGTSLLFIINNQTKFNSVDKQMKIALEYAEAGYNQYLWHLNDDVNFYSVDPNSAVFSDGTKEEQVIAKRLLKNEVIEFQEGFYQVSAEKPSDSDRFVNIKSTGWTKKNPKIKRTIEAKLRKKQFVHHVYVSNNEGERIRVKDKWGYKWEDNRIWWGSGDKSYGPLHTNKNIHIQYNPIFYDTVSYSGELQKGSGYAPEFKVLNPVQPQKTNTLDFPDTNEDLKLWAEKDNMIFKGRTCIYLDGKFVKVRNGNDTIIQKVPLSDIKNKVIYVEKRDGGGTGKWDIESGNIFISGELEGVLTIGAENTIYITHSDPTYWYDYDENRLDDKNYKMPKLSKLPPLEGGINYSKTKFSMSEDGNTRNVEGTDMLGLVANNEILILHYGWPKQIDKYGDHWNFEWKWSEYERKHKKSGTTKTFYDVAPQDITIHGALFSVNKGFGFEDYNEGDGKSNITLWGNITQNIRLAVKQSYSGYNKKYVHDPRMLYDYPPHILEPTNVGWEIHEWKETNDHLIEKP